MSEITLVDYDTMPIYDCDKADLEAAFRYFKNRRDIHLYFEDINAYDGDLTALENIRNMLKYFHEERGEQLIEDHWCSGEMEDEMWSDVETAVNQYRKVDE